MKSVNQFCDILKQNADQPVNPNERGNTVYRAYLPSDRCRIDFADEFTAEGWQQFDTDQDANYFGVWVNTTTRQTLTYAEGDWTLVECPDDSHYNAEILDACEFYGAGFIAKAIDANGNMTRYEQDRSMFYILPTLEGVQQ